jgi:Flp pilus assembly protein TadG
MMQTRLSARGEEGIVTAYVVLLVSMLMVVLGLAFDGGIALSARQAAYAEAEQAARAGAAALSTSSLRLGGVDPAIAEAAAAAEGYMAAAGHPGTVSVNGDEVVAVVLPYRISTPLLGLVGIPSLEVSATAVATAVTG